MPVHDLGNGCYRWGKSGKKYCGKGAKAKAEAQGRAAYASGYKGEKDAGGRRKRLRDRRSRSN